MYRKISLTSWTRRAILCGIALAGGVGAVGAGAQTDAAPIAQPDDASAAAFIRRAFEMRDQASRAGDQPYGAIVVDQSGVIVGQAPSRVVTNADPTAHAEMEAIRDAARRLRRRDLSGHVMYSSSRPCPMCEAAAYWAGVSGMVFGGAGRDAGAPRLCRHG